MITGRRPYPKWLVRALVVFAVGMTVFASVASREHHSTESARNAALSELVALESRNLEGADSSHADPSLAMQLALVAYGLSQTTAARSALVDATAGELPTRLIGHPGRTELALGDDGHRLAIAYQGNDTVALYGLRYTQLTPLATVGSGVSGAAVDAVALSDSGRLLAIGNGAGQVTLWSLSAPAHPQRLAVLRAGRGAVRGLSFSPAAGSLAAADADGRVQRWSLASPAQPALAAALIAPGRIALDAVSYSHDGRTLAAVGGRGTLVVWSAHGGTRPLASTSVGAVTMAAVTYSPDGRQLAAGNSAGGVDVWTLSRTGIPAANHTYLQAGGSVTALAFSRDGRYLSAGTTARTAPIWSTSGWTQVASLPHPATVTGLAFSDGDRRLISADADGTTRLWQMPAPSTHTFGSALAGVSYSTSQPRLAVTLASGRTDQWDVVDEWRPAPVGAWYAAPPSAAPPTAYWLKTTTTAVTTTTAATTSTATITTAGTAPPVLNPHAGDEALRRTRAATTVLDSTLSADGQLFAAAGSDHLVWLWDVSDPASPKLLAKLSGFTAAVTAVVLTTSGQTLFAASADHTVRIWSLSVPAKPKQLSVSPLTGPRTAITRLALSPDSRTLAAATVAGSVWLWSVGNPSKAKLSATLTAARGRLTALAFSPSDDVLVAGGSSRRLTFWHYRPYQAVNRLCALAGTPITTYEWNLYVPGAAYRPPCAKWRPPVTRAVTTPAATP